MRGKIISRFAAGTFGVCLAYSLVSQALNTESSAREAAAAWLVTPAAIVGPAETDTVPEKSPEEQPSFPQDESSRVNSRGASSAGQSFQGGRRGGKGSGRHGGRGDGFSGSTESYDPGTWVGSASVQEEASSASRSSSGSTAAQQQETPAGDAPTLQQFLSMMRCSGCRHNCSLLSPRCMKGRSKAQNAVIQYQQTYGS